MELNYTMTTLPTVAFWILGIFVFGIGALLGYFNMSIDARKKIEATETKAQIVRTEAERKLAEAERKLAEVSSLGGIKETDPGILRIKKDKTIEMDGAQLAGPLTPEKKKRLIEIVTYLRPWVEGGSAAPAAVTVPPPPLQTQPMPVPISPVPATVTPVSFIAPGAPKKPKNPEEEFKKLSIVQQIDTVLQSRIVGTALEKANVSLKESPQGGLEVHIGTDKYETIDDVPDGEIKTTIRAAIAEWETKYVPGAQR
jgi:hypothetical protein